MSDINLLRLISFITSLVGVAAGEARELSDVEIRKISELYVGEKFKTIDHQVNAYSIDRLLSALASGRTIEAIKEYRSLTGAGLKDSKDKVEKFYEELYKGAGSNGQPFA